MCGDRAFTMIRLNVNGDLIVPISTFNLGKNVVVSFICVGNKDNFSPEDAYISSMHMDYLIGTEIRTVNTETVMEWYMLARPEMVERAVRVPARLYKDIMKYSDLSLLAV